MLAALSAERFRFNAGITNPAAPALGWWGALPWSVRKPQCWTAGRMLWHRLGYRRLSYFLSLSFPSFSWTYGQREILSGEQHPGASLPADCANPLMCVKNWDDLDIHVQNNYSSISSHQSHLNMLLWHTVLLAFTFSGRVRKEAPSSSQTYRHEGQYGQVFPWSVCCAKCMGILADRCHRSD